MSRLSRGRALAAISVPLALAAPLGTPAHAAPANTHHQTAARVAAVARSEASSLFGRVGTTSPSAKSVVGRFSHLDDAHDVTTSTEVMSNTNPTGPTAPAPTVVDPTHADGDILGFSVKHAAGKVWIRYRLRDLKGGSTTTAGMHLPVVAALIQRGDKKRMVVFGSYLPSGSHWQLTGRKTKKVACPGLFHHTDWAHHTVLVGVPRACLGDPQRVRVAAAVESMDMMETQDTNTTVMSIDDALATGQDGREFTTTFTPWVTRKP